MSNVYYRRTCIDPDLAKSIIITVLILFYFIIEFSVIKFMMSKETSCFLLLTCERCFKVWNPLKSNRYLRTLMWYLVISDPLELFAIQSWTEWNYPFQKTTFNNYIILYAFLANNEGIWFANLSLVSEL